MFSSLRQLMLTLILLCLFLSLSATELTEECTALVQHWTEKQVIEWLRELSLSQDGIHLLSKQRLDGDDLISFLEPVNIQAFFDDISLQSLPYKDKRIFKQTLQTLSCKEDEGPNIIRSDTNNNKLSYYDQLIDLQPENASNWNERALIHCRKQTYCTQNKMQRAIVDLTKAIELNHTLYTAYIHRGETYLQLGECLKAWNDFNKIIIMINTTIDIDIEHSMNQTVECIDRYKRIAKLTNESKCFEAKQLWSKVDNVKAAVSFEIVECFYNNDDFESVIQFTEHLLKNDNQNLKLLLRKGKALYQISEMDLALQQFKRGLKSDPDNKQFLNEFKKIKKIKKYISNGDNMMNSNRWLPAFESFGECLLVDPLNNHIISNVYIKRCQCVVHITTKSVEEKIAICDDAVIQNTDHSDAFFYFGQLYNTLKDEQKAMEYLNKAKELNPNIVYNNSYKEEMKKEKITNEIYLGFNEKMFKRLRLPIIKIRGEDHVSNECKKSRTNVMERALSNKIVACLEGAPFDKKWNVNDSTLVDGNNNDNRSISDVLINGIEHPVAHFMIWSLFQHISFAEYFETDDTTQFARKWEKAQSKNNKYNMTEYNIIKAAYLSTFTLAQDKNILKIVYNVFNTIEKELRRTLSTSRLTKELQFLSDLTSLLHNKNDINVKEQTFSRLANETALDVIWCFSLLFHKFVVNDPHLPKEVQFTLKEKQKYKQFAKSPLSTFKTTRKSGIRSATALFGGFGGGFPGGFGHPFGGGFSSPFANMYGPQFPGMGPQFPGMYSNQFGPDPFNPLNVYPGSGFNNPFNPFNVYPGFDFNNPFNVYPGFGFNNPFSFGYGHGLNPFGFTVLPVQYLNLYDVIDQFLQHFALNYRDPFMAKSIAKCYVKSMEKHKNLEVIIGDAHISSNSVSGLIQLIKKEIKAHGIFINDNVIKIIPRSENCKIQKQCPYAKSEQFVESKDVFHDLLIATPLVLEIQELKEKIANFKKNSDYYGYQIVSKGKLKNWSVQAFMCLDRYWKKCTILLRCVFTPERQFVDGKYEFVNDWNKDRKTTSTAYVVAPNIELEREFSFNKDWDFGHIYQHFSFEVSTFLKKIDLFRDLLRKQEDNALRKTREFQRR